MIKKATQWLRDHGYAIKSDWAEKKMEPGPDEKEKDFMARCMTEMTATGRPQDQCVAICMSKWSGAQKFDPDQERDEKGKWVAGGLGNQKNNEAMTPAQHRAKAEEFAAAISHHDTQQEASRAKLDKMENKGIAWHDPKYMAELATHNYHKASGEALRVVSGYHYDQEKAKSHAAAEQRKEAARAQAREFINRGGAKTRQEPGGAKYKG